MSKCNVSALWRGHNLPFVLVTLTTTGTGKRPRFFVSLRLCDIRNGISAFAISYKRKNVK